MSFGMSWVPLSLTNNHCACASTFAGLAFHSFSSQRKGFKFWVPPSSWAIPHSVPSKKVAIKCVLMTLKTHTDSPPQRSQTRSNGIVFSFKRFPPRMSCFPRFSGCQETQGVCDLLVLGDGHHDQLPSWPLCFFWAIPGSLHRGEVRVSMSEELHISCSPLPPLPTHKKDPKLL